MLPALPIALPFPQEKRSIFFHDTCKGLLREKADSTRIPNSIWWHDIPTSRLAKRATSDNIRIYVCSCFGGRWNVCSLSARTICREKKNPLSFQDDCSSKRCRKVLLTQQQQHSSTVVVWLRSTYPFSRCLYVQQRKRQHKYYWCHSRWLISPETSVIGMIIEVKQGWAWLVGTWISNLMSSLLSKESDSRSP